MGGTMRLGLYPAKLAEGSLVREAYGQPYVDERHRHRYEVNNAYREQLEEAGLVFSGTSPGRPARRVRRAAARGAPVLRRHAGAPGVPLAADPGAPAVRRAGRGRRWCRSGRTARWSLPARMPAGRPVADRPGADVTRSRPARARPSTGRVWDVVSDDRASCPAASRSSATCVLHPGAVAVLALDDDDRVLLVRQYRHPRRAHPLGAAGRPARRRRRATRWRRRPASWGRRRHHEARPTGHVLVDFFVVAGVLREAIRVYLARGRPPLDRCGASAARRGGATCRWRGSASTTLVDRGPGGGLRQPDAGRGRPRRVRRPGPWLGHAAARPTRLGRSARGLCARSAEPDRRTCTHRRALVGCRRGVRVRPGRCLE